MFILFNLLQNKLCIILVLLYTATVIYVKLVNIVSKKNITNKNQKI